ncbi:hypothetical protein DPMN_188006 [Dreissena polymorpha]|uniref:Uncharacterized protein n=1 Tax=Dreissena polymorpha TaxID=45954 RepID=A0A9D4I9J7_DREPO|nr:hypothetical protein DPMN_188006 [Dreissena polymorpha]
MSKFSKPKRKVCRKDGRMDSAITICPPSGSATVTKRGKKEISDNLLMADFSSVCASPAKENITLIVSRRAFISSASDDDMIALTNCRGVPMPENVL